MISISRSESKKRRANTKTHSFCCCRLFVHLTNFITSKGIFERNMLKDCDKKKSLVFKFTEIQCAMSTFLAFVSIYLQENKMLLNEIARVVISKDLHIYEQFFFSHASDNGKINETQNHHHDYDEDSLQQRISNNSHLIYFFFSFINRSIKCFWYLLRLSIFFCSFALHIFLLFFLHSTDSKWK